MFNDLNIQNIAISLKITQKIMRNKNYGFMGKATFDSFFQIKYFKINAGIAGKTNDLTIAVCLLFCFGF